MRKTSPWFRLPIAIWIGVTVSMIILTIGLVAQEGFGKYLTPAVAAGFVMLLALVVWCVAALRR